MSYIERTGSEGAIEGGKPLIVVGDKLQVGKEFPSPLHIYRSDPNRGRIIFENLGALTHNGALLYAVNSFAIVESTVCRREAIVCDRGAIMERARALNIWVAGISNDDPVKLFNFQKEAGIRNHELWVGGPDFGRETGVHIEEYNGQYQRALWGLYRGDVVSSEYVFDQGGPLPDFERAVEAVEQARKATHTYYEGESLQRFQFPS